MCLLPGRPDGNADQLRRGSQAWDDAAHAIWQMAELTLEKEGLAMSEPIVPFVNSSGTFMGLEVLSTSS